MELIPFISTSPSVEDCWRGVVLYGRNTASYKFALASALLELNPKSGELVKLDKLAPYFAKQIALESHFAKRVVLTKQLFCHFQMA